jgi:Rrf2 family protein
MKLNQATRLAIWSIVELASRPGEQVAVNEIAHIYGISQHHLAKVLRTPSRAGIVNSTRGPGGGCEFTGNANRLTLYDIIQMLESDRFESPAPEPQTTAVAAEVARVLAEIDRVTQATLRSVTLRTIIKNARRNEAARMGAKTAAPKSEKAKGEAANRPVVKRKSGSGVASRKSDAGSGQSGSPASASAEASPAQVPPTGRKRRKDRQASAKRSAGSARRQDPGQGRNPD